jgi:glycosyltransferase involved in cell wall biosynthesis
MGYALEVFRAAERAQALRVLDCANSHPSTQFGFWKRECDIWDPAAKPILPLSMYRRMNQEIELADVVLCPSLFVKDTMLLNGIPPEKCLVEPFGTEPVFFSPRSQLPDHPRFLFSGALSLRKGCPYLFSAFERVKRVAPEAELICAGGIAYDMKRVIQKWNGQYTHIPWCSTAELANLLRTCTAFVLPSQEEGFARVLVEAMAAGLPVIASYESGATTVIQHGIEGYIVPSRSPAQIADAMIELTSKPSLNLRMGQAAHARAKLVGTWQDYGDRLIQAYQRYVAERKGGPVARSTSRTPTSEISVAS